MWGFGLVGFVCVFVCGLKVFCLFLFPRREIATLISEGVNSFQAQIF